MYANPEQSRDDDQISFEQQYDRWFVSLRENLAPQYARGNLVEDRPYEELARQERVITSEYQDRYLLELVQNAYDAHPKDSTDGEVHIHFCPGQDSISDDYGKLYIANRGNAFTYENLKSILSLGMSSKPPGQGIGNKGLGFRSVLQICDAPLIYSRAVGEVCDNGFEGYCFRFATATDFRERFPNDTDIPFERLPRFRAPVALNDQDEIVKRFAARGFATVIVLPASSYRAAVSIEREIEALKTTELPMHLFLRRIGALSFTVGETPDADENPRHLSRQLLGTEELGLVVIEEKDRYIVGHSHVSEEEMLSAIGEAIEAGGLDEYWRKWEGQGEVAIAIPLDTECLQSRIFTYLPLGEEAKAPFYGFLHGTFFPNVSRTNLSLPNALNEMMLSKAAQLSATMLRGLAETDMARSKFQSLSADQRAKAAIDLFCWTPEKSQNELREVLRKELAKQFGLDSWQNAPVFPCCRRAGDEETILHFAPITEIRAWNVTESPFDLDRTMQVAEELGFRPLWPGLGDRAERLRQDISHDCQTGFTLSADERIEIVTRLAAAIASEKPEAKLRHAYFQGLPDFMGKDIQELAGQPVLLAAGSRPAKTNLAEKGSTSQAVGAVFSAPDEGSEDGVPVLMAVPSALRTRFDFLDPELDWHGELASVRNALVEAKLVSPYNSRDVLRHLARIQRNSSPRMMTAALHFAFEIWQRMQAVGSTLDLSLIGFQVACPDGSFRRASECHFSSLWEMDENGKVLEKLIKEAGADSPGIRALADHLIAQPEILADGVIDLKKWYRFLSAIGVRSGLWPVRRFRPGRIHDKHAVSSLSLSNTHDLPESMLNTWRAATDTSLPDLFFIDSYVFHKGIWHLPGQEDHANLGRVSKDLYAELLFGCCPKWPEEVMQTEVKRVENGQTWTFQSPVAAFMRNLAWVPLDTVSDERIDERPDVVWMERPGDQEMPRLPESLAPSVSRRLKRMEEENRQTLRKRAGFRTYGAPPTMGAQLHYLAWAIDDAKESKRHDIVAATSKAYSNSWKRLADLIAGVGDTLIDWNHSLVHVRKGVEEISLDLNDSSDVTIALVEPTDKLLLQILGALDRPILEVPQDTAAVLHSFLEKQHPGIFTRPSIEQFELLADGYPVGQNNTRHLLALLPGLEVMVAAALQKLDPMVANTLPQDLSRVVARLSRIQIQSADAMTIRSDSSEISFSVPGAVYRLENANGDPLVLVLSRDNDRSLSLFKNALEQICQVVRLPSLEPWLLHLLAHLQTPDSQEGLVETPSLHTCASVLRLNEKETLLAQNSLENGLEISAPWIRALACMADVEISNEAGAFEDGLDGSQLQELLAPIAVSLQIEAAEIRDAARRAATADQFRKQLQLDFRRFNDALEATGASLIDVAEGHLSELRAFIRRHEAVIKTSLAMAALPKLEKMIPCPSYAKACEQIPEIAPVLGWQRLYDNLPNEVMQSRVNIWLAERSAPPMDLKSGQCHLTEVHKSNAKAVAKFAAEAPALVSAWCYASGIDVPAFWQQASVAEKLRARLQVAGVFSCLLLREVDVIAWCQVLDLWPRNMKPSLSLADHGLAEMDTDPERQEAMKQQKEEERRARLVPFAEAHLDPESISPSELLSVVGKAIPAALLKTALHQRGILEKDKGDNFRRSRKSKNGGAATDFARVPENKKRLIGMIGEIVVYHWLLEQYPMQDIGHAWKSGIGFDVLQYSTPNDGLGYDFEVQDAKRSLQIEVKASLGGLGDFHFGESEVRAAQRAAPRSSGIDYRIAYVTGLEEQSSLSIDFLPNPFAVNGVHRYRILGKGLRLRPNYA